MLKLRNVISVATLLPLTAMATPVLAACTVPNVLTNGQVADASEVMDNFNAVTDCADQAVTPTGTPTNGSIASPGGAYTRFVVATAGDAFIDVPLDSDDGYAYSVIIKGAAPIFYLWHFWQYQVERPPWAIRCTGRPHPHGSPSRP